MYMLIHDTPKNTYINMKHMEHGDGDKRQINIITLLSYQNAFVIPFRMWHNCITITSTIWKLWMLFLLLLLLVLSIFILWMLCFMFFGFMLLGCFASSSASLFVNSHFIPDFIPILCSIYTYSFLLPPPHHPHTHTKNNPLMFTF